MILFTTFVTDVKIKSHQLDQPLLLLWCMYTLLPQVFMTQVISFVLQMIFPVGMISTFVLLTLMLAIFYHIPREFNELRVRLY